MSPRTRKEESLGEEGNKRHNRQTNFGVGVWKAGGKRAENWGRDMPSWNKHKPI